MQTIIQNPKLSPERIVTLTCAWIINHLIDIKNLTNLLPKEVFTSMGRPKKTTTLLKSKKVRNLQRVPQQRDKKTTSFLLRIHHLTSKID